MVKVEHKTEFYATRAKKTDLEISLPEWLAVDKGII